MPQDAALQQLSSLEQQLADQRAATEAAKAALEAKADDLQALETAHQQAMVEWRAAKGDLEGTLAAEAGKHAQVLQELEDARAAHSADKERMQELTERIAGGCAGQASASLIMKCEANVVVHNLCRHRSA